MLAIFVILAFGSASAVQDHPCIVLLEQDLNGELAFLPETIPQIVVGDVLSVTKDKNWNGLWSEITCMILGLADDKEADEMQEVNEFLRKFPDRALITLNGTQISNEHDSVILTNAGNTGIIICPEERQKGKKVSLTNVPFNLPLCKASLQGQTWQNLYWNYKPFYTVTEDKDKPEGIFPGFMNLLGQALGVEMQFSPGRMSYFDRKTMKWTGGLGCVSVVHFCLSLFSSHLYCI